MKTPRFTRRSGLAAACLLAAGCARSPAAGGAAAAAPDSPEAAGAAAREDAAPAPAPAPASGGDPAAPGSAQPGAPDGERRRNGIAYGPDPRQRMDLHLPRDLPRGPGGPGSPPLVIFFYGGTWTHGSRGFYGFVGRALADMGALALVADYRLSPAARYPAFVEDGAAATRWAVDHARALGADPGRVLAMGHSAGAYIAAMLALDGRWLGAQGLAPQRLAGWIGLAGPYDFLPISNPEAQVAFDWPATPADSQPMAHAGPGAPRALLLAGETDGTVDPRRNTLALAERLRGAGADARSRLLPRVGHVGLVAALAGPLRWLAPVRAEVADFLRTAPAVPVPAARPEAGRPRD
jgi:acetyl esterase/lipase